MDKEQLERIHTEKYIIANMGLLGNRGRIPAYTWEQVRALNDTELEALRNNIATQRVSY